MNIEAYDIDSLRKLVRSLQNENLALKSQLQKANIPYEEISHFEEQIENLENYDPDQGERIVNPEYITDDMAKRYFAMFWGRQDVFAKRGKNGGYFPQCNNRWNNALCYKQRGERVFCDECENTQWTPLELWRIKEHLKGTKEDGSDVLGIYPLFTDDTCRFIVFDFDNHEKGAESTDYGNTDNEWHAEVDALRKMCEQNGIKPLVERSRSGRGAHVWIFFKRPIPASLARNFGFLLLDKGAATVNMKSFHYYDRMYPSQDVASSIGNLIALPLQGQAIKNGNSAFVDENWNAYSNQWEVLLHGTEKIGAEEIEAYMEKWQQELAVQRLLQHSDGVLQAATAFGKTVVGSYLISERKVSTLILLHSKDLLSQWVEELQNFLFIDEEPPEYETKTGRKKKRENVIGILHGGKNTLTGIIDVAMVQSLSSKDNLSEILDSYGMVIMDECHHAASTSSMEVLQKVKAKYVYGVSATPKRGDNMEKIIYMLLGPLRHKFTALERAEEQGIGHFFIPRYTRVVDNFESKDNINKAYALITSSEVRNNMIIEDVKACVRDGKTPVILTRMKEHAKTLADSLNGSADYVFILYGDNTDKENLEIRTKLKQVPRDETLILVATGQKIGEGFDFPRLDTLMLAAPVSFEGRLEQYIGRLNRDYEGKSAVYVYDYVDSHVRYFDRMYGKRLRTYRKSGFSIWTGEIKSKQITNAIYDSGNYIEKFEQDLVEAGKEIIISSPDIRAEKISRFIKIVKERQEKGVMVTVITFNPDNSKYGNPAICFELISEMQSVGISIVTEEEVDEHFAVIDNQIVWHGGMNLLGKEDVWDNLMRIKNAEVAAELLEISLGKHEATEL